MKFGEGIQNILVVFGREGLQVQALFIEFGKAFDMRLSLFLMEG